MSPPTRGRGSKPRRGWASPAAGRRPLRGGVDRNMGGGLMALRKNVAPYAGAWIETIRGSSIGDAAAGRPLRGGVDRNGDNCYVGRPQQVSPPTRGRGSKLVTVNLPMISSRVAPYAGAWIETGVLEFFGPHPRTSPPTRGRGSKPPPDGDGAANWMSPPTRGRGSKRRWRHTAS